MTLDHIGLNHLTWERAAYVDGVDRLPELLATRGADLAAEVELPPAVLDALGCVPSYYLRYYYAHDEVVQELIGAPTRGEQVAKIEAQLLAHVRGSGARHQAGPARAARRRVLLGGRDRPRHLAADRRRRGPLGERTQPWHAAVPGRRRGDRGDLLGRRHRRRVPFRPVRSIRSCPDWSPTSARTRRLAVDAAIHGGRDRVYRALLAHPLIGQHDLAERLADDLISAGRDHLAWAA